MSDEFISVLTPVYNEKHTLRQNIQRIQEALTSFDYEIVIVDDNSPDGTGEIANELADAYSNIKVIHRSNKMGLGTAYKEAFHHANGAYIISMDSDLSHNPEYIPSMLTLAKDYDIVIGSRLCKGGKIIGRAFIRDLASLLTNKFIMTVTFTPIFDWTSGMRVYRRKVWEEVMPSVHCNKWDFQFESLYKSLRAGKQVCEVPISFHERAGGDSKFNAMDAVVFFGSFIKIILGLK